MRCSLCPHFLCTYKEMIAFFFWFFLWTVCWLETFVPAKSSSWLSLLILSYLHHVLNFLGAIQTRLVRNERNFSRAWLQVHIWQAIWSSMIFFYPTLIFYSPMTTQFEVWSAQCLVHFSIYLHADHSFFPLDFSVNQIEFSNHVSHSNVD